MLTLPGIRLGKARERHIFSENSLKLDAIFKHPHRDINSFLKHLSQSLDIEVLTLIDRSVDVIYANLACASSDHVCNFTLPSPESPGPLVELIEKGSIARGRGNIFTTGEIFPVEADWCDFVPMDVNVNFSFLPLAKLAGTAVPEIELELSKYFLLATSNQLEPSNLEARAVLCGCLVALKIVEGAMGEHSEIEAYLLEELARCGRATCIASPDGLFSSKTGWLREETPPHLLSGLHQAILSKPPQEKASEIRCEQAPNVVARAYPLTERDEYMLVLEKTVESCSHGASSSSALMRFMSSIAHEIKNPLTGIAAGVQYLARKLGPGMPEGDTVEFILAEINRLNRIVDDLYRIARPPELNLTMVKVDEIVTRSLLSLGEPILRKHLSIVQDFKEVPEIRADADRLQQVIINLLKNAIEVSPEKAQIKVTLEQSPKWIEIRIRDHGPGVAREDEVKIFEPFYSTKPGGTGLGLCISKRIIEQHGGDIVIEHPDDGGACFLIRLPIGED